MADQQNELPTSSPETLPGPMTRRGKRPNLFALRFPRLVKAARLGAFAATVVALVGGVQLHRAQSQMGEQLVGVGQALMQYADADHQDGARTVQMNGAQVHFSSGMTHDPVHTVLEHFTSVCEAHDGGTVERFTSLPSHVGHRSGSALDPIFRYETGEGGVVACLDMGEDDLSLDDLNTRVGRFNESHDLHDVGDIRYVFAESTDDGTHFVTFWTDGTFRLDRVMPRDGHDAAGTDLENVPRPPGAFRTMSAAEDGNPDAAVQYMGSSMTEWELEAYYQQSLTEAGWTVMNVPESAQPRGQRLVEATRDDENQMVFVALDTAPDGRGTATIALTR